MKNIVIIIAIILSSSITMACESSQFIIYYVPLRIEFYAPPSREYIMRRGINFEIDSCLLKDLFEDIKSQNGLEPSVGDYISLRIMIVNKKTHDEIFITQGKVVLSLSKKKKYSVNIKFVDEVLKELKTFINKNKLKSDWISP